MATLVTTLDTMIPPVTRLKATINGVVTELTKIQDTTATYHWADPSSSFSIKWLNNGSKYEGELHVRNFRIEWNSDVWGNSPILTLQVFNTDWELRTIITEGDYKDTTQTIVLTDDTGVNAVFATFASRKLTNVLYFIGIGCFYNGAAETGNRPCTMKKNVLQFDGPSIYFAGEIAP